MVALRATAESDLDSIAAAEAHAPTNQWIGDTSLDWHRKALADPDQDHLVVLSDDEFAGFAVLVGLRNPHRSIELRRIVVAEEMQGRGLGRQAFRAAVDRAFSYNAHRVCLEVKEANHRALALYTSEGFTREGTLRETVQEPDGSWSSFVVMSQLVTERDSA